MPKCSIVLMYDTYPQPMPLGLTEDPRTVVVVKQQLIREAEQALHGAEVLGDHVLVANYRGGLEKLRATLDLLVPRELEDLYVDQPR